MGGSINIWERKDGEKSEEEMSTLIHSIMYYVITGIPVAWNWRCTHSNNSFSEPNHDCYWHHHHLLLFKESFSPERITQYMLLEIFIVIWNQNIFFSIFCVWDLGVTLFPCLPYLKIYVYLLVRDIKLNSNFTTSDERYSFLSVAIAL